MEKSVVGLMSQSGGPEAIALNMKILVSPCSSLGSGNGLGDVL